MIFGNIQNVNRYYGLSKHLNKALDYMVATDFSAMEAGRYDVDGDNVFAMVQHYQTKPARENLWEAHRNYVDVQFMVAGKELFGYAKLEDLTPCSDYDSQGDGQAFQGTGTWLPMVAGDFAVVWPEDGHMPRCTLEQDENVVKVVIKVICE